MFSVKYNNHYIYIVYINLEIIIIYNNNHIICFDMEYIQRFMKM